MQNTVVSPAEVSGALPDTDTVVVRSISYGAVTEGGGKGKAPSVTVHIDLSPDIMQDIASVEVALRGPSGDREVVTHRVSDGEDLEEIVVRLSRQAISGEWALEGVLIQFRDAADRGYPERGLKLRSDDLSSLMDSRFIDLVNPDQDLQPPLISDLSLPDKAFTIENANGKPSVDISLTGNFSDENAGLHALEFEFDIGAGEPAVVGFIVGLFGDLRPGERQLSNFPTEAPPGLYRLELLRVSDDQGNTRLLLEDDLASLGYQTLVPVVDRHLTDTMAPTVSRLDISSRMVTIAQDGARLPLALEASDPGADASGVQSVSLVLVNALGSRYELLADVTFSGAAAGSAAFMFPADFPAGAFTIERLTVNDAAFNRRDVALENRDLTVINPLGGDIAANRLVGTVNNDLIVARAGNDLVIGGEGNDVISLGDGHDISYAGKGDAGDDTVVGGRGNDVIGGGAGDDMIVGGLIDRTEVYTQFFQADSIVNDGQDTLFGGAGNDTIYGGSPRFDDMENTLVVHDKGSIASDRIWAGAGDDFVQASQGDDIMGGGTGADTLNGGRGDDIIFGGRHDTGVNDIISGEEGHDLIYASGGHDNVRGGADNDTLFGGAGDDTVSGGGGHDEIYGGAGDDILTGGGGADQFFFAGNHGMDVITDFTVGRDSLILANTTTSFTDAASVTHASRVATVGGETGVMINTGSGTVFLEGLTLDDLGTLTYVF